MLLRIIFMNRPLPNKHYKLFLLLSFLPLLHGCVYQFLDWSIPHKGYQLLSDVPYGENERQQLDIYRSTNPTVNAPTLVFFYGGSWSSGEKKRYRFIGQAFASAGYTTVIPNYRLYPDNIFPDFIEDGAKTIRWLQDNNYTSNGVVLAGHSAGAHIAAMLALDKSYLRHQDVSDDILRAWIGYSGPYDKFNLSSKKLRRIFSLASPPSAANPINFVDETSPPALLIHGLGDRTVLAKHTQNLAAKLLASNVKVTTYYYPDNGHISVIASMADSLRDWSDAYKDTINYLSQL